MNQSSLSKAWASTSAPPAVGHVLLEGVLRNEIEQAGEAEVCGVVRVENRIAAEHFSEDEEVIWCRGTDRRNPLSPELVVDMFDRVDSESGDVVAIDDVGVQVNHACDDAWILGEQIVEPEEVSVVGALAVKSGIAPIVIDGRIIEPVGALDARVLCVPKDGGVRKRGDGVKGGEDGFVSCDGCVIELRSR